MSAFKSVVAWAMTLMVMTSFPSTAVTAPVDDTSAANSLMARASVPWAARHGLTSTGYQTTFNQLVSQGYHLTCVSGYTINNDPRYAAIWEKSPTAAWVARHGLTSAQYQSQFNTLASQGYRPILVDGYSVAGSPRFAALWDKSPGAAWIARHDMTSAQYQSNFNTFVQQGYRLKHVSGYSSGNQALYAALWEKSGTNVPWVARHGLTSAQYQSQFNTLVSQGYRLVHVNGYVVNNVDYYAAIWDKSPSGAWVARHGLSAANYQSEVNKWVAAGYRLKIVSAYTLNSNQDRYAALFIKE